MKKLLNQLFEEKVSRRHRKSVMLEAEQLLADRRPQSRERRGWIAVFATAAMAVVGVTLSRRFLTDAPIEKPPSQLSEDLAWVAHDDLDDELLEEIDLLEEMELLEDLEEIEEWMNS